MTAKTRFILLLTLIAMFLIIAPYLVLYSLGYRVDFENMRIVPTGGIYIRIQPSTADITIDSKIKDSTGVFSNSIFFQNLLPGEHTVSIKKEGYYDYEKNLSVKGKEVTKLENVILFNKNIIFETESNADQFSILKQKPQERFVIRNANLYYANSPENSQLTLLQKNTPILKSIVTFNIVDNKILWMGSDGFLKNSSLEGKNTENISQSSLKIDSKKSYSLEILAQHIFLKENTSLFLFDSETKLFQKFYGNVKDLKISPDGQKIAYFNENEIFIYYLQNLPVGEINNTNIDDYSQKITDLYWLNNDYIIFEDNGKIIISEIDHRGNINKVTLPGQLSLKNGSDMIVNEAEIFFSHSSKKLYILTQEKLISSDKVLP